MLLLILACLLALAACDSDTPSTPGVMPSVAPALTQVPTQAVASPTPASTSTPTSIPRLHKGDEVALSRALEQLRQDALDWKEDALLIMVANVKPGQEGRLLGMALSDPDLSDPTPGAIGRNWVLLAASPSAESVVVLDLDGTKLNLVAEGRVSAPLLDQLTGPALPAIDLADLDLSNLADYGTIETGAGEMASAPGMTIALLDPARLGLNSLFDEEAAPQLVYQLFSPEPEPRVLYFDALTGAQVGEVAP